MGTTEQLIKDSQIHPFVEIMDSTLRDGEQTSGVSFLPHEKLMIARMLMNDVNVDRIEVASARVSDGEKDAVRMICRYAERVGMIHRREDFSRLDQQLWLQEYQPAGERLAEALRVAAAQDSAGASR